MTRCSDWNCGAKLRRLLITPRSVSPSLIFDKRLGTTLGASVYVAAAMPQAAYPGPVRYFLLAHVRFPASATVDDLERAP